jgi:hypothetical protein
MRSSKCWGEEIPREVSWSFACRECVLSARSAGQSILTQKLKRSSESHP